MNAWLDNLPGYERKRRPVKVVYWDPIRCPECNSKSVYVYCKRGRIRYMLCRDCETAFKAVEKKV